MNEENVKEIAGWLSLVHPEIVEEYTNAKAKDPEFRNLAPSHQYFDTKEEIDALVDASKYEFTQKHITHYGFKECVGYYYKDQLAFVYNCTCVAGGKRPHLTYWTDFFRRNNEYKERLGSERDCHYIAIDGKHIVKMVQRILKQISTSESS